MTGLSEKPEITYMINTGPPRAGPDPFRRWNESSQRAHLHRREGGQRRQQRRHRPGPASCVRGLLPGYRSGLPPDG